MIEVGLNIVRNTGGSPFVSVQHTLSGIIILIALITPSPLEWYTFWQCNDDDSEGMIKSDFCWSLIIPHVSSFLSQKTWYQKPN